MNINSFKEMRLRSFVARTQLEWTIHPSGDATFKITHIDDSEVTFTAPRETMQQLIQDWQSATKPIENENQ